MMWERLLSAAGILFMLFVAWCFSENRRKMDLRVIISGMILQFTAALLLLKTGIGTRIFAAANTFFIRIFEFSKEGAVFVFNEDLVQKAPIAFGVLPTIIFISTLSAVLFHLGIIQGIVRIMAWCMVRVMNISGIESLSACANIYISMTEAPLLIRSYLSTATRSEIMAIMSAGMATIAGGVMAAYISMGASAGHLLTASLMSAPAALVIAKIMVPETEESPTKGIVRIHPPRTGHNVIDAACRGASDGFALAMNVGVMLLAAVAMIGLLNWILSVLPNIAGAPLTLQRILGWLFLPFAVAMGVSQNDIVPLSQLLGEKTVLNEFIAYADLIKMKETVSERTFVIAQYALCSFANFGSIAIMIGGIGQLAPERRETFAQLGIKAAIAGTLAGFCTACIAGVLL